jgi:POT family proton-dependent oligopeptide transporter
MSRAFAVTPLRKIGIGLFLTVASFLVSAWIEARITAGQQPSIFWQLVAYVVLTAAEVMVSITCLEFSYTQAPRRTKSFVMALFLMSVSLGNLFTSAVNFVIQEPSGTPRLAGADYYLFFAGVMAATAVAFVVVASRYREASYMQVEQGGVA